MMPFLFPSDALSFNGSGYGALTRCVSCTVKQELGSTGVYELEMQILTDDPNFQNMAIGRIIVAKPNLTDKNQAFVIESMSKPINNVVTVYATHIAQHRAMLIPVTPVNASGLQDAFTKIMANSVETNPFTLHSTRSSAVTYKTTKPMSFREILGGTEGSLLDVYGGEYIFDNFDIELVSRRGRQNDIQVAYGRNMTSFQLDEEYSFDTSITGILPYWYSESDGLVTGSVQYSANVNNFLYHQTIAKDYSSDFDSKPTSAQLNAKALSDVQNYGSPLMNTQIAFNEFDKVIRGNTMVMQLGDTVQIVNPNYQFNATARICSMTFNVLADRYDEIQVGQVKQNINDAIRGVGGGGGGFANSGAVSTVDLLWSNQSPSSNFAAQTLPVSGLNNYKMFMILYSVNAAGSFYSYRTFSTLDTGKSMILDISENINVYRKFVNNGNNTLTFEGGYIVLSYNAKTADNSRSIPIKIYGIN